MKKILLILVACIALFACEMIGLLMIAGQTILKHRRFMIVILSHKRRNRRIYDKLMRSSMNQYKTIAIV